MGKPAGKQNGSYMAAEIDEAPGVFCATATADYSADLAELGFGSAHAIYTVARGPSDAAANILSYEFMRGLGVPVTSLPPSVFSLEAGVSMPGAAAVVISQSGASDDLVMSAKGIKAQGETVVSLTNQPNSAFRMHRTSLYPSMLASKKPCLRPKQ